MTLDLATLGPYLLGGGYTSAAMVALYTANWLRRGRVESADSVNTKLSARLAEESADRLAAEAREERAVGERDAARSQRDGWREYAHILRLALLQQRVEPPPIPAALARESEGT